MTWVQVNHKYSAIAFQCRGVLLCLLDSQRGGNKGLWANPPRRPTGVLPRPAPLCSALRRVSGVINGNCTWTELEGSAGGEDWGNRGKVHGRQGVSRGKGREGWIRSLHTTRLDFFALSSSHTTKETIVSSPCSPSLRDMTSYSVRTGKHPRWKNKKLN